MLAGGRPRLDDHLDAAPLRRPDAEASRAAGAHGTEGGPVFVTAAHRLSLDGKGLERNPSAHPPSHRTGVVGCWVVGNQSLNNQQLNNPTTNNLQFYLRRYERKTATARPRRR